MYCPFADSSPPSTPSIWPEKGPKAGMVRNDPGVEMPVVVSSMYESVSVDV